MSNFGQINDTIENSGHPGYALSSQIAYSFSSQFEERAQNASRGLYKKEVEQMPQEAFDIIKKFMNKCETLKGPENYEKQAISSDLARACASIPVESPEMAAALIKTTGELFEMRSDGAIAQFQLETFDKQGRFLGDKKVAEEYLNATAKSFAKLDTPYDSCINALAKYKSIATDHPEMAAKIVETVSVLQDKFADNPYYKECTNDILKLIGDNERVAVEIRTSARNKILPATNKDNSEQKKENQVSSKSYLQILKTEPLQNNEEKLKPANNSVKDKAKEFMKGAKSYSGGKNLFTKLKDKMKNFVKEKPELAIAGGAAAVFAGIGTINPELAAAGAIVMMVGIKEFSNKLKNMRGLNQATSNNIKMLPSKPRNLNALKETKNGYGR